MARREDVALAASAPSGALGRLISLLASQLLAIAWLSSGAPAALVLLGCRIEPGAAIGVGAGSFALVALGLYAFHDRLLARGPPTSPASEDLIQLVDDLATRAGVRPPAVRLVGSAADQTALAYGFPRRRQIRLGRGFRVLNKLHPAVARFVVAHELAHCRGADIETGYLARAAFQAYCAVSAALVAIDLAGLMAVSLSDGLSSARTLVGLRELLIFPAIAVLSMSFLIASEYANLLRLREGVADAWAASWSEAPPNLFGRAAGRHRSSWFDLHPTPARRARWLLEPLSLLRPGPASSLLAGLSYGAFYSVGEVFVRKGFDVYDGGSFPSLADHTPNALSLPAMLLLTLLMIFMVFGAINHLIREVVAVTHDVVTTRSLLQAGCAILLFVLGFYLGGVLGPVGLREALNHPVAWLHRLTPQGLAAWTDRLTLGAFLLTIATAAAGLSVRRRVLPDAPFTPGENIAFTAFTFFQMGYIGQSILVIHDRPNFGFGLTIWHVVALTPLPIVAFGIYLQRARRRHLHALGRSPGSPGRYPVIKYFFWISLVIWVGGHIVGRVARAPILDSVSVQLFGPLTILLGAIWLALFGWRKATGRANRLRRQADRPVRNSADLT